MTEQERWHREWWSAQLDGMSGSYVLCCCTNNRHHPDFHLNLTKLNALQQQLTEAEGFKALADDARRYVAHHGGGQHVVEVIKPQDARAWIARYDALTSDLKGERVDGTYDGLEAGGLAGNLGNPLPSNDT